jgi:hypothetical protein
MKPTERLRLSSGGSALLLTLNRQVNTRDVDAVFEKDKDFVRKLAADMAAEFGWDENWLNDGVKGWLSTIDADPRAKALFKTYPSEERPGMRVFVAKPEYLFAMKCRAMRVGGVDSSSDIEDIRLLARAIGIASSEDALALVEKFYPNNIIEPKTRFGLRRFFRLLTWGRLMERLPRGSHDHVWTEAKNALRSGSPDQERRTEV